MNNRPPLPPALNPRFPAGSQIEFWQPDDELGFWTPVTVVAPGSESSSYLILLPTGEQLSVAEDRLGVKRGHSTLQAAAPTAAMATIPRGRPSIAPELKKQRKAQRDRERHEQIKTIAESEPYYTVATAPQELVDTALHRIYCKRATPDA